MCDEINKLKSEIKDLKRLLKDKVEVIDVLRKQNKEQNVMIESLKDLKEEYQSMESNTKCPQCDELIGNEESLEDHMLTIHSVKCKKCEKTFASHSNLETHKNFDHSSVSSFPCKKCSFVFQSKAEFDEHLSGMEHNMPMKVPDDTDNKYDDEYFVEKCNFCGLIINLFHYLI